MGVYLNTLGRATLGIGICGRCSRKFSLDDLWSDPNSPGLRVCAVDRDEFDPYRLPARQPETLALRYPGQIRRLGPTRRVCQLKMTTIS